MLSPLTAAFPLPPATRCPLPCSSFIRSRLTTDAPRLSRDRPSLPQCLRGQFRFRIVSTIRPADQIKEELTLARPHHRLLVRLRQRDRVATAQGRLVSNQRVDQLQPLVVLPDPVRQLHPTDLTPRVQE